MNVETFFEKFEVLADASGAVARMRRLILDLAVRGQLVAQNTDDEPADELLRRVQAEKSRLVKAGDIKKHELLPPVTEDSIPFPLPVGWVPSQLGDIAVCLDYKREPINGTERDLRIAGKDPKALYPYYGATQQQGWIDDFLFDEELVLLGEDGVPFFDDLRPKAYLVSGKTWVNNHAHVFRGILVSNLFLTHWLNTFDYTGRVAGTTRSKLNQAKAVDIPIALPPLAEQKRIVAKVDELMALCDRLEAQQAEREARHTPLARAALARFAETPTPANLEYLFHPSFHIDTADLRKSILTMAVQGKLVEQDAGDEPVVRWAKQHAVGVADGPRNLPHGWEWLGFSSIFDCAGGIQKTPARAPKHNAFPYLGVSNVQRGRLDLSNVKQFELEHGEVERRRLLPNDLLIVEGNGSADEIGRCAKWRGEIENCVHQNHVHRCRPTEESISDYVILFLNSPYGVATMKSLAITSSGLYSLSLGRIRQVLVPFPPLAEQRRIVAKVNQLMALVDQLEADLAAGCDCGEQLMDAVVAELTHDKRTRQGINEVPT